MPDSFEKMLKECISPLERFVNFKISNRQDAKDIIQETCLTAYLKYPALKNQDSFKPWLISIAKNKCNDYYRKKAQAMEVPLDALNETVFAKGLCGIKETNAVRDTLELLGDKEKQIIYLYYFKELSQEEISERLNLPLGTVKSRLHYAKKSFKEKYLCKAEAKGEKTMSTNTAFMPEKIPEYEIIKSDKEPFAIKWEEIMGWFIVPKLGEKLTWAMYDFPEKKRTEVCVMEVTGKAQVHGIEGVEISAVIYEPVEEEKNKSEQHFVAQLTDTHCRILAESHVENGVRKYFTFLDGEDFLENWGFGEENCGNEIHISQKYDIIREDNKITVKDKKILLDAVGRYTVKIAGKEYDTLCVIDCSYNDGTVSVQYLDRNGKTVLWRRFNRDDWAYNRYGKKWSEMLPDNEKLTVNGETYVHWYDCITDYIL
ncbi:MAG: RNA polymerase sigma factor [Ruminiclostridium sp.]|nr:RNA polymerase sigma factor [Ruminiclostridium sp.]